MVYNFMSPFHFMNLSMSAGVILMFIMMFSYLNFTPRSELFMIFGLLLYMNMLGLIPYSWGLTSFMMSNFFLGLLMWSSFYFYKFVNLPSVSLAHFLPVSSPLFLWSFLICLEVISQIIRPVTLSLRITCNIMAGHVVLSLVSNLNLVTICLFLMFELVVGVIQAVVFSLLLYSYKTE
uniref:ATP synthase subunit a n=1 Tax=Thaumamermis cosgrovei TaxID=382538 RepID=Q1HBD5_THACS|nr:ATP synthase F0 subunit 6 [Thaumamermis cosgrovei]ABF48146.1 ATP synthase F0 subunit 6 [Thaumamermis cosgrovei]ABF48158.1 ATP synthase F0 subunit 6 [Thaumamermis cosgrovei]